MYLCHPDIVHIADIDAPPRSHAELHKCSHPVTFAMPVHPFILAVLAEQVLQLCPQGHVPVEFPGYIRNEYVGCVQKLLESLARIHLLPREQEDGLQGLAPLPLHIKIDIAPHKSCPACLALFRPERICPRPVDVEVPVPVTGRRTPKGIEEIHLACLLSYGIDLIRIQVGKHIGVLPCQ